MTPKMMAQSPTSLQTFLTCAKQYQAKYITKEVKFVSNANAEFGTLLHSAIEDYLISQEPLPTILLPIQDTLDRMGQVLSGAETKLAVDKSGAEVAYSSRSAYQKCIVDAIISNADNSVIIAVDWKTGKKRDAQTQHDMIKKCIAARYPQAKRIVTLFIYLFAGESDLQEYQVGQPLFELDRDMNKLAVAYATNSFPAEPNGLCKKWCDVVTCVHNGRYQP